MVLLGMLALPLVLVHVIVRAVQKFVAPPNTRLGSHDDSDDDSDDDGGGEGGDDHGGDNDGGDGDESAWKEDDEDKFQKWIKARKAQRVALRAV